MILRPYQQTLINDTRNKGGNMRNEKHMHGLSNNPIYRHWINMKSRCNNPNSSKYHLYGGKGISVCEEWEIDVRIFYNWAIENSYKKGLTLDRIDGNGNYEPSNCRWATYTQQARNSTQNHLLTYKGQTKCIYEWAEYLGISKKMLSERIRRGWSVERALITPNTKTHKRGDISHGITTLSRSIGK